MRKELECHWDDSEEGVRTLVVDQRKESGSSEEGVGKPLIMDRKKLG